MIIKKFLLVVSLCSTISANFSLCFAEDKILPNDENVFPTGKFLKRSWGDFKELPTKPFHWEKKDWLIAGGIIGASFAAFLVDGEIRRHYQENRSQFFTDVSDITTHFGDYKMQAPLIGGIWIAGVLTENKTLHKIAADGMLASLLSAGMVTPLIVYISGRALPNAQEHELKFRPFTPNRFSYPSGHTTEAFAMATVLDQNLRKHFGYWQTPIVYAFALGTAHSRIYDHTHYLSDIILGAGIGWSIGYWISNKPRNKDSALVFIPQPSGLLLGFKF